MLTKPEPSPDGEHARAACAAHGNRPDLLIEILHDLQDRLGYVPEAVLPVIANALNLSRADVHGVVSFYHDFRREPAPRHVVKICRAESCLAQRGDDLYNSARRSLRIESGETSADGKVTLEPVYCLGLCALSPAIMVDGEVHGRVDPQRFDAIMVETLSEAAR